MSDKLKAYILLIWGLFRKFSGADNKISNNNTLIILSAAFGDGVIFQDYLKKLIEIYEKENRKLHIISRKNVRAYYMDVLGFDEKYFMKCDFSLNYRDIRNMIHTCRRMQFKNIYTKDNLAGCVISANLTAENIVRLSSTEELNGCNAIFRFLSGLCFTKTITVPMDTWEMERHAVFFKETEGIDFGAVPSDMTKAISLVNVRGNNNPYAVICVDSSVPYRRWNQEGWMKVAQWLHKQYGFDICFVGERRGKWIENLQNRPDRYIFDYVGKTSLPEWFALIRYSRLVLSVDSGIIHVAASLGVPSVCLCGFYELSKYFPYRAIFGGGYLPLCITSQKEYGCRCCLQRSRIMKKKNRNCYSMCFKKDGNMICLADIRTEDVIEKVRKYLSR